LRLIIFNHKTFFVYLICFEADSCNLLYGESDFFVNLITNTPTINN